MVELTGTSALGKETIADNAVDELAYVFDATTRYG